MKTNETISGSMVMGLEECDHVFLEGIKLFAAIIGEEPEYGEIPQQIVETDEEPNLENAESGVMDILILRIRNSAKAADSMSNKMAEVSKRDLASFGAAYSMMRAAVDGYIFLYFRESELVSNQKHARKLNSEVLRLRKSVHKSMNEALDLLFESVSIGS